MTDSVGPECKRKNQLKVPGLQSNRQEINQATNIKDREQSNHTGDKAQVKQVNQVITAGTCGQGRQVRQSLARHHEE